MKNFKSVILSILINVCFFGTLFSQTNVYDENFLKTVFFDDFSGDTLDRTVWRVGNTMIRGNGVMRDTSATVEVSSGNLELSMISYPGYTDGEQTVDYAGGEVSTYKDENKYTYGIFECRANFAGGSGSWPAAWMIGGNGIPRESTPGTHFVNEIDYAEYFCDGVLNVMEQNIHHYHNCSGCANSKGVFHHGQYMNTYNTWLVYKCIWTPTTIKFYIGNVLVSQVNNTNALCDECNSEWFPQFPQRLILSQQITDRVSSVTVPQTSYFDYMSVKQFIVPPQITLSAPVVCSSENAILSKDPDAINFEWTLTPASLFSGSSSGTDSIVPLTATGVDGRAKLSYSFDFEGGESYQKEKYFWVGEPILDVTEFLFTNGIGEEGYLCTSHSNNQFNLTYFNDYCECDNYEVKLTTINNQTITQFYSSNGIGSLDNSSLNEGFYLFSARGHNTCGWGPWVETEVEFYDCSQMMMMVIPNPASYETTVSIISTSKKDIIDENETWDLEIYSPSQNLKEKKTKLKGTKHIINVSGWKEGVYILRAKYKNEIMKGKLVVKEQ